MSIKCATCISGGSANFDYLYFGWSLDRDCYSMQVATETIISGRSNAETIHQPGAFESSTRLSYSTSDSQSQTKIVEIKKWLH